MFQGIVCFASHPLHGIQGTPRNQVRKAGSMFVGMVCGKLNNATFAFLYHGASSKYMKYMVSDEIYHINSFPLVLHQTKPWLGVKIVLAMQL